ncbi:unnamed protein product, partial [Ectocarpus sp. 12 AP-2014]
HKKGELREPNRCVRAALCARLQLKPSTCGGVESNSVLRDTRGDAQLPSSSIPHPAWVSPLAIGDLNIYASLLREVCIRYRDQDAISEKDNNSQPHAPPTGKGCLP